MRTSRVKQMLSVYTSSVHKRDLGIKVKTVYVARRSIVSEILITTEDTLMTLEGLNANTSAEPRIRPSSHPWGGWCVCVQAVWVPQ